MQPHLLPLVRRQRPPLLPDAGVDRDPPEVVDQCGAPHADEPPEPAPLRRLASQVRDARRVPGQIGRDQVGEVAHRREPAIDRLPRERQPAGAAPQRASRPNRRVRPPREDPLPPPARHAATSGSNAPRARADDAHARSSPPIRRWNAASPATCDDPHRQRDLLALRAPSGPLPSQRSSNGEQALHRRGSAQPVGQHPRHLAQGGEVRRSPAPPSASGARPAARAPAPGPGSGSARIARPDVGPSRT